MVGASTVHNTCCIRLAASSSRTHRCGVWLVTGRPLPQGACGVGTETTINMAYIASMETVRSQGNGSRYFGESRECVAAVKHFGKAPATRYWIQGTQVKGKFTVRPGTVIATFDADGKYKGHAAIYESQTSAGLRVYDQWSGREFQLRVILFRAGGYVSNDGDAFYGVE